MLYSKVNKMTDEMLHGEIYASFYLHASLAETLDESTSNNTNTYIQSISQFPLHRNLWKLLKLRFTTQTPFSSPQQQPTA